MNFGDIRSKSEAKELDHAFVGKLLLNGTAEEISYFFSKRHLTKADRFKAMALSIGSNLEIQDVADVLGWTNIVILKNDGTILGFVEGHHQFQSNPEALAGWDGCQELRLPMDALDLLDIFLTDYSYLYIDKEGKAHGSF